MKSIKLKVKSLNDSFHKEFGYLSSATLCSAGLDLRACLHYDHRVIYPHERFLVETGLAVEIPSGYVGFVLPRSGLGHKEGIILGNSVGVIDSDYRGQLMVSVWNTGHGPYMIKRGSRIAQLVVLPCPPVTVDSVNELSGTDRGDGGFGSTGDG